MADTLTFFTHPMSRARVARWMLEETGLPYEQVLLDYGTTMKAPEYRAINPMGKVPALKHGDIVVTENAAIGLYLADLVSDKQLAPPPGSKERGSYYRWISFMGPLEHLMLDKQIGKLGEPGTAGYGTEEDVLNALTHAIGDREYLVGDHFTMADLLVSAYVGWYLQFKLLQPRDEFVRFAALHAKRPAAVRANEIDDALMAEREEAKG